MEKENAVVDGGKSGETDGGTHAWHDVVFCPREPLLHNECPTAAYPSDPQVPWYLQMILHGVGSAIVVE